MAVSFGGISSANPSAYTVGAGSNPVLIAFVARTAGQQTALKFNSVSMTQIANFTWASASNDFQVYALSAPPQGSSYNFTDQNNAGVQPRYAAHYFGASQIYSGYQFIASSGTSASLSITPDTSTSWVFTVGFDASATTITPSATGLTSRVGPGAAIWYDSNGPESTSYLISYTIGASINFALAELLITPHFDNTITSAYGSFSMTGFAASLLKGTGHLFTAAAGTFTMTGIAAILTRFRYWINAGKESTTFTNKSKSSAPTWSNKSKDSSIWTNKNKH